MAAADTARLITELTLRDKMSAGLRTASASLGGFEKSVGRIGKGAGQLAGGFARLGAVTAGAVAAGLGFAASKAIDFEDAFAGVRKTVDEADLTAAGLSFDKLAESFRKMATEIPIAATEFAAIGETAGALGIKAGDIETFTKTVALLGVTTNLTSAEAAESLGKIGTILGLTGKDYTTFADALVNLGNKGASTESEIIEITKRFGAAGQAAGLSTPQILAFSSAIASAGVEPEAAGSSLSRLFGNLIKETALATDKGKEFAEVSGKSFKDFARIVETDTSGAMLLFLDQLKDLDKFEQEIALKNVGITNVRDRNAIRLLAESYDRNLIPALETAKDSVGALSAEATKRFDTLRSKLTLLKQNFIEGALIVGEGFTPAIGRATDKLIAFLKVDANKAALKTLGEDIGRAIDGIDFNAILAGVKDFAAVLRNDVAPVVRTMFDLFKQLPGPAQALATALAVGSQTPIVGGAISQIGKGLANVFLGSVGVGLRGLSGILGKVGGPIGGISKLLAQPVFVTNWPVGGLGGGAGGTPGAAGGGGTSIVRGVATGLAVAGAAVAVGAAIDEYNKQKGGIEALTTTNAENVKNQLRGASTADLIKSQKALATGLEELKSIPDFGLLTGGAQEQTLRQLEEINAELKRRSGSDSLEDRDARSRPQGQGPSLEERDERGITRALYGINTTLKEFGYTPSEWEAIYAKAAEAGGSSQINTLAKIHDAASAIAIADAETSKFLSGTAGPFFRDGKNQTRLLASLEAAQQYFNTHGDTVTAAKLGADIALLRAKIGEQKPPEVNVNVRVNTAISVRDQQRTIRSAVSTGSSYGIS